MDEIMKHIQDLVIYENFRDDDDPSKRLQVFICLLVL